jgi:hypothetical protein
MKLNPRDLTRAFGDETVFEDRENRRVNKTNEFRKELPPKRHEKVKSFTRETVRRATI